MQPALNSIQPDRQPPSWPGAPPGIQLSLMPDLDPTPPAGLPVLPDAILAGMIAQAAKPQIAGAGDE